MPKVNYGFKGEAALTATQALAAGAPITSQDYQYTAQLNVITTLLPPGPPTGLTVTAGNQQLALSWTAPSSNGGSAITGYVIEYTPAGGSAVTTSASGTTATITNLTNNTAYGVRVAAVNQYGEGGYGGSISATPVGGAIFTALSVPANSFGRTVTGVGSNVATVSRANESGFNSYVDFTISEPSIMLWQAASWPPERNSGGILMDTAFRMFPNQYLEKSGYYRTEITIWGSNNHFAYPWPQAGTYRLNLGLGYSRGVEGTVTLIPAPAILYASANASSSGRRNFWTHSGGRQVTFTSNSYALEEFTFTLAANATVTITRTASAQWYTRLESNRFMAGAELDKYGTYSLVFPASASSTTSSVALLAGNYKYANVPSGVQVTFSIP